MQERRIAPPLSGTEPPARGTLRRLLLSTAVAALVLAADQSSKTWAEDRLRSGSIHVVWKLDLSLAFNSGSAFSLVQGWAPVLGGLAVVAVVLLLALVRRVRSSAMAVALGLVIGGALGNLSDRVFRSHHGAVIDFIALHFWPTFNVADSAVVVGTIWAGWLLWRSENRSAADVSGERGSAAGDAEVEGTGAGEGLPGP